MDLISLAAAKNYANKVTAGFKSVQIEGMNLIFTLLDDSKATITLPAPANGKDGKNGLNGISVQDLSIDNDGSLLCHMSDGTIIDAGKVPMTDIELTDYYTKEEMDKKLKNAIENIPETDLTNYYTKEEVDTVISNMDIPETDLTNYYSKNEIGDISSITGYLPKDGVDTLTDCINKIEESKSIVKLGIYSSSAAKFDTTYSFTTNECNIVKDAIEKFYGRAFLLHLYIADYSNWGDQVLVPVYISRDDFAMTLNYDFVGIWILNGVARLRTLNMSIYFDRSNKLTSLQIKLMPCSENQVIATQANINEALANIDVPTIDLTNYYSKNEIGDITSLVGWTTESTAVSYFKNNPGVYDMVITLDVDTPTKDISIPSDQTATVLEMIKTHHKDKCFWINFHAPSEGFGSHTLVPLHLSRFQRGETWKQIIPSFHFYKGELHIRNVEFETFTPTNADEREPISLKIRLLAETANSTIATKNDITAAVSNISIPDMTNYYTIEQVNNAISGQADSIMMSVGSRSGSLDDLTTTDKSTFAAAINEVNAKVMNVPTPKTHDGEGMIGWYNTAVDGENLTSSYGVTPDMVRAVKAGDKISWPSRTRSGATENTICTYNMTYYVYNKDEMDDLETIDIMIGKVPDSTYTYVIVGDSVYKNTY